MERSAPDRNLALELVRVTEAAALGAARWVGRGEKESADQAAVDAMRLMLDTVSMDGVVVIGGLAAITAGSSVRRLRGAVAVGCVVGAGLIVVNVILAWLTTHPMLPGE